VTSGRVLVTQWAYYLHIVRELRNETRMAMVAGPQALPASAITSIVMSALAVEAFINELAEAADMAQIGRQEIASPALVKLHDLANVLKEVEDTQGSVTMKYQMAYLVLSGGTFPRGNSPFQEFKQLVTLRNLLVHLKPGDKHSSSGHVEPRQSLMREFQQRGYTRTRGRKAGDPNKGIPADPLGGMSWLQEIQTVQMADWAYSTARSIIAAIGAAIPIDPPLTGGIEMLKQATQDIPSLAGVLKPSDP
jgi:hypothetical protein